MTEVDRTIYKICREQAGYTQERAAELLSCSVRALARYEAGEAPVPDDIAYNMVRLYNSQFLAVEHLRCVSQVAAQYIPEVGECNVQTASLRLYNRVMEFADNHRDRQLLKIAEDNVIDDTEQPLFDIITRDLDKIISAAFQVKYAKEAGVCRELKP